MNWKMFFGLIGTILGFGPTICIMIILYYNAELSTQISQIRWSEFIILLTIGVIGVILLISELKCDYKKEKKMNEKKEGALYRDRVDFVATITVKSSKGITVDEACKEILDLEYTKNEKGDPRVWITNVKLIEK
jgi:hypothetical protein